MRILVFESMYGLQELTIRENVFSKVTRLFKRERHTTGYLRTIWGNPEDIQIYRKSPEVLEGLAGKTSTQHERHIIVLRAAKPVDPNRAEGKKVIKQPARIGGEEIFFGVDELFLTDLKSVFRDRGTRIDIILPAAPALYFFVKAGVEFAKSLLRDKKPVALIDMGFRHTTIIGFLPNRDRRRVQIFVENKGVYDIVDKISVATGSSFEKTKEEWKKGEGVFYQELKDLMEGALSKGAYFLRETENIMISGVTMIPPAGALYSKNVFAELGSGKKLLSPYLLFSLVLQELGATKVVPVIGERGREEENEYIALIATYMVVKNKLVKKRKGR